MRTYKFLIFISILVCNKVSAQWSLVYNFPDDGDINDLEITDDSTIFIAEDYFIYKSQNLGVSWDTSFHNSFDGPYFAIDFLNNDTGYIARGGESGLGMKTVNAGESWDQINPDNSYFAYNNDVFALTANDLYFAMANVLGIVQISHDGGETSFIAMPSLIDNGIAAITCLTVDTCLCVSGDPFGFGDGACEHNIYKSYDGGVTWNLIQYVYGVKDIFCTSHNVCYARGDAEVVKSIDAGETWESVFELDTLGILTALTFIDDSVGFVASYHWDATAKVYATINGGLSWTKTTFDVPISSVRAIDCINKKTCFLAGSTGLVYKTTNGGMTSIQNNNLTQFSIYPNPALSLIHIAFQNLNAIESIITTNYLSEKVQLEWGTNLQADVSSLPAGIYFTTIFTEQGRGVQKWVKM